MHHHIAIPLSWIAGFSTSISTLIGSLPATDLYGADWLPLIVQAGMAGVVVIVFLKHIPQLIKAQETANKMHADTLKLQQEAFERTIDRIVTANDKKDEAWRTMIAERGYCLVRDRDSSPPHSGGH